MGIYNIILLALYKYLNINDYGEFKNNKLIIYN